MIRSTFYMLCIFSFIGCKHGNKGGSNHNFIKIKVVFKDEKTVISTDIIDSIEYIKLEDTKEPIGNVKKMIVEKNKIMLWDSSQKSVWVFNGKGKFINRISALGLGPHEYASMNGFSFTPPDKIHINDWHVRKIKTYSADGEFIGEETTDGYVYNYLEHKNLKCFFNHDFGTDTKGKYYFNFKKPDSTSLGFLEYKNPFRFFGNGGDFIVKGSGHLYLTLPYYDTIYSIENQRVVAKYVFDFGVDRYPTQDLYNAKTLDEINHILSQNRYEGNLSNVVISENHMVLNFNQQIDIYSSNVSTLIYNMKTNSLCSYNLFDRGQHEIAVGHPMATDGKFFYSLKNIYEMPEEVQVSFRRPSSLSHENANPVIVKYNYKI